MFWAKVDTSIAIVLILGVSLTVSLPYKQHSKWPPHGKEGVPTTYFVNNKADKSGSGKTIQDAFSTIQECVDMLSVAGDRCSILPGVYHEEVEIDGKFASPGKPFIIEGYGNKAPVLDGTTPIGISNGKSTWKHLNKSKNPHLYPIFYTPYSQKVWQLFVDGEMMTNARWPNAKWSDKSIFVASLWGKSTAQTNETRLYDENGKLSKSGIDANDSIAVLNIGSWDTFVAKVTNHKKGQGWFDFKNTWGSMQHIKPDKGQYFLEAKMSFLDHEEEWFIDDDFIYVWAPNGKNPTSSKVKGKNSTYAFTIKDSSNINFKNLDFFATTIKTIPDSKKSSHVGNLTFENLNFKFPSYSRRILGEPKKPQIMNINAEARNEAEKGDLTFFNCTWYGSDGIPLSFSGRNVHLQNNLWELNDWSGANNDASSSGGKGTIMSGRSTKEFFNRNTLIKNGASAAYRPNKFTLAQLNEISGQCWGLGQNDGSGIQVMIASQNAHSVITQNWIHDQPKLGIRFDCPNQGSNWDHLGRGGTVKENVVWNAGGIMVKGDEHIVTKNLAFKPKYCLNKPEDPNDRKNRLKPHLNVPHWIGKNPIPFNNKTKITLNIADYSNGGTSRINKKLIPLSGSQVVDNFPQPWDSCDEVVDHLVDFENRDFRPKADSSYAKVGAGPYSTGISAEYWIPGRQTWKASKPVPANGKQIPANRDALMFLQGYEAEGHLVYLASSYEAVSKRSTTALHQTLEGISNVVTLPENLQPGGKYFWAVDAKIGSSQNQGDVWMFTVANE